MNKLPARAGVVAVNFSKERFRMKNWVDTKREPWPDISETTRRRYQSRNQKRKVQGSLMSRSGRLKRSIRKIYTSQTKIIIGTDVTYARILNDGGHIRQSVWVRAHTRTISRGRRKGSQTKVKAHTRKMNLKIPPRRFIGQSAVLMRRIERLIERDLKQALNS